MWAVVVRKSAPAASPAPALDAQSVHALGGFKQQARDEASACALISDAKALQEAGAFAIVLESIPSALAKQVTASVEIPTIGIGAGPDCDGQVLVSHDAFGMHDGPLPPFVRQYEKLGDRLIAAARTYIDEVRSGQVPERPTGFE